MDWVTEHINALATVASILTSGVGFALWIKSELLSLRLDVSAIKEHQKLLLDGIKQLNTILTQIAVQDTRINMMEKSIDELRHGRGYINQ